MVSGTGVPPVRGGKGFQESGERAGRPFLKAAVRALAVAAAICCGSASADVPASAYVQDGLVAQFDGIENAGVGTHDANATTWVNLATGATDAVLPEGLFTVTDTSIVLNKGRALAEGITCASNTTPITIQARARATAAPTGQYDLMYVNISSRGGVGFDARTGNGYAYYQPNSSSWGSQKSIYKWWGNFNFAQRAYDIHTVTAVIPVSSTTGGSVGKVLQDGVAQAYKSYWTSSTQAVPDGKVYIGNVGADYEMYSVRIYNRELDVSEVARNAAVDRVRFEGADLSELAAAGYRYNETTGKLEARVQVSAGTGAEVSGDGENWSASMDEWVSADSSATIYARSTNGNPLGWWAGLPSGTTVSIDRTEVALAAVCPIEASVAAHVPVSVYWRGETSALASEATNWVDSAGNPAAIPDNGDTVVLDTGSAPMTWDLDDIQLGGWRQTAGYSGVVTFLTGRASRQETHGALSADGLRRELLVSGNVTLEGGQWTHLSQPAVVNTEPAWYDGMGVYRLIARIGGSLTVASNEYSFAKIDVSSKSYRTGQGAGTNPHTSHGGQGTTYWGGSGQDTLGSVKRVRTMAPSHSWANQIGGGNIEIEVGGKITVDGSVLANSAASATSDGPAGGGIWLIGDSLEGSGSIIARSIVTTGGGTGGGGRISLWLTGAGKTFDDFTGLITTIEQNNRINPGTIYMQTADQNGVGDLLIEGRGHAADGNWWATSNGRKSHTLLLPTGGEDDLHFRNIYLTNGVSLAIGTGAVCRVDGEIVGDSQSGRAQYTYLIMRGGTLALTRQQIFSNLYFRVYTDSRDSKLVMGDGTGTFYVDGSTGNYFDSDLEIFGNLHVLKGGRIQQAAPLSQTTIDSGFRCNLKVSGDVTIDPGGSINVTAEGSPRVYGYRGALSDDYPNGAGYHGGMGPSNGCLKSYGSIFSPTNIGSGGKNYAGGGAIKLFADGRVLNNGGILANGGGAGDNIGTGGGGSIWIRAAGLSGSGLIEAHGGDSTAASGMNPGGGGRISLELTGDGEDFTSFTGHVTARGGAHTNKTLKCRTEYSGAGTVFYRTAADTGDDAGLLVVDNESNAFWTATMPTMVTADTPDRKVRNVRVANGAWFSVERGETFTVTGDFENRSANQSDIGEAADATTPGGTVEFADASRESRVTGSNVFSRLLVATTNKTVRFGTAADSFAAIAAGGSFTVTGEPGAKVCLRSVTEGAYWPLKLLGGAAASVTYADVKDSDARYGLAVVAGDTNTDSGGNENWSFVTIRPGDPIEWTGGVSSDWTDSANWNPQRVPVDSDVVTVKPGDYSPVLQTSVTLNRLVVRQGASLDLGGCDLTITNGLYNSGALSAASSTVRLVSETSQEVRWNGARPNLVEIGGGVRFLDGFSAGAFSAAVAYVPYTISFCGGASYDFGTFLVAGALFGEPAISLVSTESGVRWNVGVTAKGQVSGATISDSAATGITLAAETPSVNGGNNVNWVFGVTASRWSGLGDGKTWTNALNWAAEAVPDDMTRVVFDAAATVTVPAGVTAAARSFEVDSAGGLVVINAADAKSRLSVTATFEVADGGKIELNVPATVAGAAFVRSGGVLSHSIMGETRSSIKACNRLDMTVLGDMTVEAGGAVDVIRKGYNKNLGSSDRSRTHGGRLSPNNTVWAAYGSVFHPVHGGESYDNWSGMPGGGVIRLQVAGVLNVSGDITADGYYVKGGSGTAAGSVWITAGSLAGAGSITAVGGKYDNAGGSSGSGGRIAMYFTGAAGTNAFTGTVTAKGGSYYTAGSLPSRPCGTVYWQFADEPDYGGTIVIDNAMGASNATFTDENGVKSQRVAIGGTDIPAGEEGDAAALFKEVKIIVRNNGRLYLTGDVKVRDLLVEGKSDVFLNGHDMEVLSLAHKRRRGWSSTAYVLRPNFTDTSILGNLHWRLPGLMIFVK
ncbi:MAG: hypothetical protein J6T01_02235 [Kiritimatiellae bacterium]|nr:hypothetical protein [Kiritimatiellia bacterium]